MKDNVRFPAGGNNFEFGVGRAAGAGAAAAAQAAAAAAAAGAAAGAAAPQPITDGLTLSGAANNTQANIFTATPVTKQNAAATAITDGLGDIGNLGQAQGANIAEKEGVGAFLAAAR